MMDTYGTLALLGRKASGICRVVLVVLVVLGLEMSGRLLDAHAAEIRGQEEAVLTSAPFVPPTHYA